MGHITDAANLMGRYPETQKLGGSTEIVNAYIDPAETYIEGRLSLKFTIPFNSSNLTAVDLVVDEAYHRAMITRTPKRAEAIKKNVEKRLEQLLSGKAAMIDSAGETVSADDTIAWSSTEDYHPVFGMGGSEDFHPDQDQLDDEEDARA